MTDKPQPYDLEISLDDPNSGGYTIENVVKHELRAATVRGDGTALATHLLVVATTAGGRKHEVQVNAARFISLSTDPGDDPQDVVRIGYVDSESLTVTIGERSETFTHDEHGHSGMEAAEATARMFAAHLGIEVVGE